MVQGGKILMHKPGESEYAVEVVVDRDLSLVQTALVRFAASNEASAQQKLRDEEREVSWCGDHARLREELKQRGLASNFKLKIPAGQEPVRVIIAPTLRPAARSICVERPLAAGKFSKNMSDKIEAPAPAPPHPLTELQFTQDPTTPRWIKDVFRFLPVKSQFILSGNIRDRYAFPTDSGKHLPLTFRQYLVESLKLKGYDRFVVFNPVDGFVLATPRGENEADCATFFKDKFKINFDAAGRFKCSLEKSLEIFEQMAGWKENFIAILGRLRFSLCGSRGYAG